MNSFYSHKAWDVFLREYWNGYHIKPHYKLIDTVFYSPDCDATYVRDSLINHDGYSSAIVVRKAK